jgi:hypothetical protein
MVEISTGACAERSHHVLPTRYIHNVVENFMTHELLQVGQLARISDSLHRPQSSLRSTLPQTQ